MSALCVVCARDVPPGRSMILCLSHTSPHEAQPTVGVFNYVSAVDRRNPPETDDDTNITDIGAIPAIYLLAFVDVDVTMYL